MEIAFRIDTVVISRDRFRVVLAQETFRPARTTVLAKGCFPLECEYELGRVGLIILSANCCSVLVLKCRPYF